MTTRIPELSPHIGPSRGTRILRWSKRLGIALGGLLGCTLVAMVLLRFINPPTTPVMLWDQLTGQLADHRPIALDHVSPSIVRAVVASEDNRFCRHAGVDLGELRAAIEEARRGRPRGASTITMQVVKNVFLWPQRSYLRKALELPLAFAFDFIVPKRRILEIYLNIAEWGPGIYGVEAAAWNAFGKPATDLDDNEAALLAVSLPNPGVRDAADPSDGMERLAARLLRRMAGQIDLDCLDAIEDR